MNALALMGSALSLALAIPVESLWSMRNGYALCTSTGLDAITRHLAALTPAEKDALRTKLPIGVHSNVEITDDAGDGPIHVSQAFCSALPVAYSTVPPPRWAAFATPPLCWKPAMKPLY